MVRTGALSDLRVIDCTHVVAGAWCSMILADLGADVIKVEGPKGDVARALIGKGSYANYPYVNRNKRNLGIDLSGETGREVLRRIVAQADVFVENFRPGAMARMGLDYEAMSALNPGLVYCSISGFGTSGPYKDRGGLDLVTQAMSGIMSFTGEPDGGPLPVAIPLSDLNAGTFGAIGVLSALHERKRSGKGQHVQTTLLEAAFAYTVNQTGEYLATGDIPQRVGARGAYSAPYESFPTADGFIVIAAGTDSLWRRTAEVIGVPDMIDDPRFTSMSARLSNRDAFREKIIAALSGEGTAVWIERLAAAGIPIGSINNVAEAIEDPQLRELGAIAEVAGERYVRTPIDLSRTPVSVDLPPPAIGEHSLAVLSEFGFSRADIDASVSAGAVLS